MPEPQIIIAPDGTAGGFRFTFDTEDGAITGRVIVKNHEARDKVRTPEELLRAAKQRIKHLCEGAAQASEEGRYADET